MQLKLDYAIRETGANLRRNVTITIASVLTVAVSLALVGASLMLGAAVRSATARWQGGIEFVVFLNPDATQEQIDSVGRDLQDSPEVQSTTFVDQDAAYEEFKKLFSDSPEMVDTVSPDILPPSFRVEPVNKDLEVVQSLGKQFESKPGVRDVVFATDTIRAIQHFSESITRIMIVVAVILLGAALLLVLNTIRMAMFARRREIEVMKLVGATNAFIRGPFVLEGLVQGITGALVAVAVLLGFKPVFEGWLPEAQDFPMLAGFTVDTSELVLIFAGLGVVGCLVGGIGAAIAVTRFLDV